MRVSQRLLLLISVAAICLAGKHDISGSYDFGLHAESRIRQREITYSSIVAPLPLVDDKPVVRREIRELYRDKDAWTLYILALNWLQYMPQDDQFSYYQLAAIHGAPGVTWNSVNALPGNENIGYCHHVSVLFPTWHRPYMALYEQTLYNIVQFIATLWPESDQYYWLQKARSFRIPYWDCCRNTEKDTSAFPDDIGGQSTVNTSGPNGEQLIWNPLYSYTFKPFNSSIFPASPWNTWPGTKRAPQPMVEVDAVSNNSFVARAFDMNLASYQQRLYNLFAHYDNYSAFSNEGWITDSADFVQDSIESLHDSIHIAAGGYFGHLAIIGYSAFDPFFALHHANMDRVFAMWQVLNPNSFIEPTPAVYATRTSAAGDEQNSGTVLTPFKYNETSFWTSEMVRDHEKFGYTYDEVAARDHGDTASWINKLYTTYSPVSIDLLQQEQLSASETSTVEDTEASLPKRKVGTEIGLASSPASTLSKIPRKSVFAGNEFTDWLANVRADKNAYECSYNVYLFWDQVPDDVLSWPVAPNLVGTLGVFGMKSMTGHSMHKFVSGTIPLTSAILQRILEGHVLSLHVTDAEAHLRRRLKHGVALVNGTKVEDHEARGLSITVIGSATSGPPAQFRLAKWTECKARFELFSAM